MLYVITQRYGIYVLQRRNESPCVPFFECIIWSNTESTPLFFIVYGDSIWIFGDCSQRRYRWGTSVHITYIQFMPVSFWVNCLFLPALSHNLYRYGILLLNLRLPGVLFSVIFLMCVGYHLHLHVPYSCHWHVCFICNILCNWNIT